MDALTAAGFAISTTRGNDYRFLSDRARDACETYGVVSKSLARKQTLNTDRKEHLMTNTIQAPDFEAIKQRQQQAWASGDFSVVAARIMLVAEHLVDTADLHAGWRVLDVATGSGNAAIAAARLGCQVVGVDYVPALLERGRKRAAAEGPPDRAAGGRRRGAAVPGRLLRRRNLGLRLDVRPRPRARPPSCSGLPARWNDRPRELDPDGFIGELFRTVSKHMPPPAGLQSPMLWGTEDHLHELFADQIESLDITERTFTWRFTSAEELVTFFRLLVRADPEGVRRARGHQAGRPRARPIDLANRFDRLTAARSRFQATYTEAVAVGR